jgi:hypothetical protein
MRQLKNVTISLAAALLMMTWLPSASAGQHVEPLVDMNAQIEAARKLLRTERRLVIATELVMTPAESKAFWPIYNEYAAEIQAVGDREVRIIKEYAENFDNISDEFAARALKEAMAVDSDRLKIRETYVKRFKKVLPIIKVVRFWQVEHKLDAVIDFQLAGQIPLMEESRGAISQPTN